MSKNSSHHSKQNIRWVEHLFVLTYGRSCKALEKVPRDRRANKQNKTRCLGEVGNLFGGRGGDLVVLLQVYRDYKGMILEAIFVGPSGCQGCGG